MGRRNRLVVAAMLGAAMLWIVSPLAATARPGHVLSANPERIENATVTSILYESTGLDGRPIEVTGFVVIPDGPAPAGGRPIVAWAHPTTGVAEKCAASQASNPLGRIPGLAAMLARGYIVTATDYPGLGSPGAHPYLVGISEGRAVLDSVRAARELAGRVAGDRFVVWGHSQGGHAALFTGKLAASYAPELKLEGVAAAAPASELAKLFNADLATPAGKILTAYTLYSWNKVYHAPLAPVVGPAQLSEVERIAGTCINNLEGIIDLEIDTIQLAHTFLKVGDLTQVSPWDGLIARNTPWPPLGRYPVFIVQGTADKTVPYPVTVDYAGKLCRAGNPVDLMLLPGVPHSLVAFVGAAQAVDWMSSRFAGAPPPSTCAR